MNNTENKTKHTPGPWKTSIFGGSSLSNSKTKYIYVNESDDGFNGNTVALVLQQDFRSKAEAEANAHLIAAAPEMLEALKLIKDWQDGGIDHLDIDLAHLVSTVINKAEGGQ